MDGNAPIAARPEVLTGASVGDRPTWRVPVELALAATSSAFRRVVIARRAAGDRPQPSATVFQQAGALYAIIDFHGEGRPGLLFQLDVNLWENL